MSFSLQSYWSVTNRTLPTDRAGIATLPNVISAQNIIGYTFSDIYLLWEALQAPASGVPLINGRWMSTTKGNYGIAVVGDTALKTALSMEWFKTGTTRETWATHYCELLTDQNLANICQNLNLWSCLQKHAGGGGRDFAVKGAATLVEAVAGAIFLDAKEKGIEEVKGFVERSGLLSGVRPELGANN